MQIQSPFGVGIKDPSSRAFVTNGGVTEDVFFSGDYTSDGVFVTSNDTALGTVAITNGATPVESGSEIVKGTTLTLTATPAQGAEFVKWSDGQTTTTINIVTTGDPMYYTAIFKSTASSSSE
jgi:type IV secretory pathway VirB9-like protein